MSDALVLSDVAQIFDGPHATPSRIAEGPYFLNIASLSDGRLDLTQSDHVSEEDFALWTRRVQPREGDVLFSYETRLGEAAVMPAGLRACLGRRMALLRPDPGRVLPRYLLYYYLSPDFQALIEQNTIHGATVNRIGLATMGQWPVQLPNFEDQLKITQVLDALDKKIACNSKTVDLLWQYAEQTVLAAVLVNPKEATVAHVAHFQNSKRAPLSAQDREKRPGPVPYYGATGVFGSVDVPIFNERLALVGEDGSVITESSHPVVQYIWGPSWINNHAHVLTGKIISTELLVVVLRCAAVDHLITGAVQPKLNMKNLKSLRIQLPSDVQLQNVEKTLDVSFSSIRVLTTETQNLSALRDTLLPELMSGRLRVRDAEEQVGEVLQ